MASVSGKTNIRKESVVLTLDSYKTPNTIPLLFSFDPFPTLDRKFTLEHHSIDGKGLFALNGYFSEEEGDALRAFSMTTSLSQKIYGNEESAHYGEIPAKMMDGKERWQFFANPPSAIQALFQLFHFLSYQLDAQVTTLPWCLSDQKVSSNCVATNFLHQHSRMSTEHGKHRDYYPENGLAFEIPCLYSSKKEAHPARFRNGDVGRPLMMTVMVYATADHFRPDFGMGTLFYHSDGKEVKIPCHHMQMVFFEGDIWHTIEESRLPEGLKTWRISYVFKMIFNPNKSDLSLRHSLSDTLHSLIRSRRS